MTLHNISQDSVSNIDQDAKKNMGLPGEPHMLPFTHGTNIIPEADLMLSTCAVSCPLPNYCGR
jgi:hypothetical protein